jgi:small subunit ribosomal protein S6
MNTYETVFIVRPDLQQDEIEKELEFFKGNIEQNGGKIIKVEPWGRVTMAYAIENYAEGYYFLIQFEADINYPEELTKRFRYNENVLRFVIVAIDDKKFKLNPKKDTGAKRYVKKPGARKPREGEEGEESAPAETEESEETTTTTEDSAAE